MNVATGQLNAVRDAMFFGILTGDGKSRFTIDDYCLRFGC